MPGGSFHLPAFVQSSVLPVPEQIEHDLNVSSGSVVDGNAHAEVGTDVLTLANRHLHLRQHVPICFRIVDKIPSREEFHHRRPQAAQTMIRRETLAEGGIEEDGLRGDVRVTRQVGAELRLYKRIRAEKLVKGGKSFKGCRAGPETSRFVAGGQNDAALQAED